MSTWKTQASSIHLRLKVKSIMDSGPTTVGEKKKNQKGKEKKGASSALFFCLAHEKEAARDASKEQNLKFLLSHKLI